MVVAATPHQIVNLRTMDPGLPKSTIHPKHGSVATMRSSSAATQQRLEPFRAVVKKKTLKLGNLTQIDKKRILLGFESSNNVRLRNVRARPRQRCSAELDLVGRGRKTALARLCKLCRNATNLTFSFTLALLWVSCGPSVHQQKNALPSEH